MRPFSIFIPILASLALVACGDETSPRDAMVLPVDGLDPAELRLAPATGRCEALVAFVKAFSAQHAPGRYGQEVCEAQSAVGGEKLTLEVTHPGGSALLLVVRSPSTGPSILSCQSVKDSHLPPATRCRQLIPGPQIAGITKEFLNDDVKLQDFILTLSQFIQGSAS